MAEKKHTPFTLLKILQEETDEDHILSAADLIARMNARLGLSMERRTLYSNIEILRQAGYEISDFRDNGKGYYLISRQFEKGEVLLLCNAIHASHFINSRQSADLIAKLLDTLSVSRQKEFTDAVYLENRLKQDTGTLFYNIETISEAIRDGKMLAFTYMHYDRNKKLKAKRSEEYIAEPRYIVYREARPYLITTSPRHDDFTHYRIDRIRDPRILSEPSRILKKTDETEAYRYTENKLFMFAGETMNVSFRCEERIMDQMIDIFGTGMKTMPAGDGCFIARVQTTENGALFLAQQFLDAVEITEPASLRQKFRLLLKEALARY